MKNKLPLGWVAVFVVLTGLVAALLILTGFLLGNPLSGGGPLVDTRDKISTDTLVKEALPVSEYVSLVYRYTSVAESEQNLTVRGWTVPLTTKKYLVVYDGTMKLGIDGGDIRVEEGEDAGIRVILPPVRILTHQIHEETTRVYDQTLNIFNPITIQEYINFTAAQKTVLEEQGHQDAGVFAQARASAEEYLGGILRGLPESKDRRIGFFWDPGDGSLPSERPQ
ncbi:MAG: DUF4230 domain-containing protein [Spirochaetaceae bacterium]|jgi:hypothetical protein|nr:DUF4230 domain-containing protein [Spirochaetaceae bacterium]